MITPAINGDAAANTLAVEQGVLGCLILGAPIPPDLAEEAFVDERHKVILDTLRLVEAENVDVDLIHTATIGRLRIRGMLAGVGDVEYLQKLADSAPTKHNLSYWLDQLRELHGKRVIKGSCGDFMTGLDDPRVSVDTLIGTFRKTLDYLAHSRNGKSVGLSLRTPNEILDMKFDDSDCIMGDRLLAIGQNATVCGPSSIGKSRLILQQAVAIITGRPFVGLETHGQGLKWLFLQAENSNRRYHFDLERLKRWVGEKDWLQVNECLRIHTLETDADGFLQLDSPIHRSGVAHLIDDAQPDFIVFDCLWNFQIGDLIKDTDMAATLLAMSRLSKDGNPNRTPIVLHHSLTGRAGAAKATGYDRASFSRNSKVLHAWTRGQINVSAGSATGNDTLVLSCGKCSNGREFPTFAVHFNPDTHIYEVAHDFDLKSWESDMSGHGSRETINDDRVRELCAVSGSSKTALVNAIREDCYCSKATAYRRVDSACKSRTLSFSKSKELYFRA